MSERKGIAITTPSSNDVLWVKGLRAQRHPGNIQYRNIIQEKVFEYSDADKRSEKDNVALSVFNRVRGRFLTRDAEDGKYYVTSQEMAIVKIKQALRDRKNKTKNPESRSMGTSRVPKPAPAATSKKKCTSIAGGKDKKSKNKTELQSRPLSLNHHSSLSKAGGVLDKDMMKVLDICKHL